MKKQYLLAIVLLSTLLFVGCEKEEQEIKDEPIVEVGPYSNGVFITNEGGWGAGNSSVSFYSTEGDSVINNIFNTVNELPLGDLGQSMTVAGENAYICVNGSSKIEVVTKGDFKSVATIEAEGVRYFVALDENKGYASSWNDVVYVIDLNTNTIVKTITVGINPEQMVVANNKLYVGHAGDFNVSENRMMVIDTDADEVINTLEMAQLPSSMEVDANGALWVLSQGFIEYDASYAIISQTPSQLVKMDPATDEIVETLELWAEMHPQRIAVSPDAKTIYIGGGFTLPGFYKVDAENLALPTQTFIDKSFYGFLVNELTGNIFTCEATSFTGPGLLHRYSPAGELLGTYEVGVIPNGGAKSARNN
ncbi:MAG: hypothetical protein JEZ03_06775 [Bacteroidales bacterium]|nr:hypothetical protein [Bacteroidales bacterium]